MKRQMLKAKGDNYEREDWDDGVADIGAIGLHSLQQPTPHPEDGKGTGIGDSGHGLAVALHLELQKKRRTEAEAAAAARERLLASPCGICLGTNAPGKCPIHLHLQLWSFSGAVLDSRLSRLLFGEQPGAVNGGNGARSEEERFPIYLC